MKVSITNSDGKTKVMEVQEVAILQGGAKRSRKTYTEEEQMQMRLDGTTQGRKGCATIKFCMSIHPEAHAYIHVMSKLKGISVTKFVNDIIFDSMEKNREDYEKVVELQKGFVK